MTWRHLALLGLQLFHHFLQLDLLLLQLLVLHAEGLDVDAGGGAHVPLDVVHGIGGPLGLLVQTHQY